MAKPLLFITGFLGAGKTTLLRGLLDELKALNRTADVILNDFENAEIDASTLQGEATSIFPIAASCACCGSLEDLVKLCLAAQSSESDIMLIELNGTADPLPVGSVHRCTESFAEVSQVTRRGKPLDPQDLLLRSLSTHRHV